MNVSMNTSTAPAQNASDTAGLSMLKKANDIQAQSIMALLNSVPPPPQSAANLPSHLGQNINITA